MPGKKSYPGWPLALALLLILSLNLAACGDSTATAAPAATTAAATTAAATTAAASTSLTTAATNSASASGSNTGFGNNQPVAQVAPGAQATTPAAIDRKIIRNATIWVQSSDVEQMLAQLRSLAVEQGGYVFSENTNQQNLDNPTAVIVLQVPSQAYEITVTRIRQAALKVTRQESSAQDVSEEYVDLQSQIVNLKRTEEGLQKLIDKTVNLQDILNLQKEMTQVRGEIEKRQGRLNFLDKRSAFSTITVNVALPPAPPTPTPTPASPPKRRKAGSLLRPSTNPGTPRLTC
jgi:hypothetical protein